MSVVLLVYSDRFVKLPDVLRRSLSPQSGIVFLSSEQVQEQSRLQAKMTKEFEYKKLCHWWDKSRHDVETNYGRAKVEKDWRHSVKTMYNPAIYPCSEWWHEYLEKVVSIFSSLPDTQIQDMGTRIVIAFQSHLSPKLLFD